MRDVKGCSKVTSLPRRSWRAIALAIQRSWVSCRFRSCALSAANFLLLAEFTCTLRPQKSLHFGENQECLGLRLRMTLLTLVRVRVSSRLCPCALPTRNEWPSKAVTQSDVFPCPAYTHCV